MARKGENIFKRRDGRWEARYFKGYNKKNKIIYGYVYATTYLDAKRKRNEILLELDIKKETYNKRLFANVINVWLEKKKVEIKESTYSRYYEIVKKYIIPAFGEMRDYQITNENVTEFVLSLINLSLSNKTIKDIVTVLKQIFKFANINISISSPKVEKNKIKILSLEEQKRLETYIKNNFDNVELGIFLALYMGLRIGEICGLKFKDIDIENKLINVNRTVQRVKNLDSHSQAKTKIIITAPKTESSKRCIPIPSTILPYFAFVKANAISEEAFLLSNKEQATEPRSFYNKYQKILSKLGLAGFSFHTLRHTFATRCIELGFDPKTLMEILGHSDIKITLAFYVHPTNNLKTSAMEKLKLLEI